MYGSGEEPNPFDADKNSTGQGGESSRSRQQREEQARANPPAEGSHCTNFSVQRLLPTPSAFAPEMLQDDPSTTQDHMPATGAMGPSPEHTIHPSHAVLAPVGYRDLYHSQEPGPSRQNYQDPGPSSRQRWSNNFFHPPGYPVPHPSSTSPPTPNHLDIVVTPTTPSPPQPSNGYMDIYHPDNAGLHTLCQAATMMSSEEEGASGFDYQPPLNVQMNSIPTHPPPPYYYHFQSQPCENHLPPQSTAPDQTSPDSPPHPAPMYVHVQDSGQPGPSFLNRQIPQETGACEDLEEPDPSYLSEQPGPSFLNLDEVVEDMEEPGLSNSFAQLPSDNIPHPDEELGLQPSSNMILSLPPTIQNETAAGGGGDGTHPPTSQSEAPPTHSSGKQKSKRTRTAYTQVQQDQLEMAYHANPYPDGIYRQKVSDLTGIPPDRIQVWFQNRRARGKKQARTGSISIRSKVREERLHANLRRRSAIAEAAQNLGISIPQNVLAAAACNMHIRQQQGPGILPSEDPQNEEETHAVQIQQQSNQIQQLGSQLQQQNTEENQLQQQSGEMQQENQNQLEQQSGDSIHPGPLLPPFHQITEASVPNTEPNTSVENENCPQPLPLMPNFGCVPASMRPPPPYNHLSGSATICYYPPDPGQGNPTSSLPIPPSHLNMYCFPPPPGPSRNQSNLQGPSPPQPHTPGPSPPQPHTPAASTPQQVPGPTLPHPMGPSFHHFHPLGPPFSHPLGPPFPHPQPPAPSIPLPGPHYTPGSSFPLPHHPAPSFPVPLLPHPTPPLPPPHMLFPPSGTMGLIPTSPSPSPHQFAAISNLVPHPESPQTSESPDQNQQQSS